MNSGVTDSGRPTVGQLVRIRQGREAGQYAVLVGIESDGRYVWIADGKKRKADRPKKKNLLHLELFAEVNSEVANSLAETGHVTNGKLRFAVQRFCDRQTEDVHKKGE